MLLVRHGDIYVSDLGAAPARAGRILRFDNPISGTVIYFDQNPQTCSIARQRSR
jgi:hypothetical protein